MSFDISFSGSAEVISSHYTYVASGGLTIDGVTSATSSNWATIPSGGLSLGSSSDVQLSISLPASGNLNLSNSASATITFLYNASGSLSLSGKAPVVIRFKVSNSFTWDISQGVLRSWRVEGKCQTANSLYPTTSNQNVGCYTGSSMQYFTNIQAHSISDLCERLKARSMFGPIKKVQMWSLPVNKSDWTSSDNPNFNRLIDIDFSVIPECIDFTVDQDLLVTGKVGSSVILFSGYNYEASGALGLSGQVINPISNYFSYEASGGLSTGGSFGVGSPQSYVYVASGGLSFTASADYYGSDFGTLSVFGSVGSEILSLGVYFGSETASTLVANTNQVAASCCVDITLPQVLLVRHELNRSSHLTNFLRVNGLTLPPVVNLMYNQRRNSWHYNKQFRGNSVDQDARELWSIIFEFGCLTENAVLGVPADVWGFSILVRRVNLSNSRMDLTRLVLEFDPTEVCDVSGSMKFNFTFNTLLLSTSPSVVKTLVFVDEIGAFNGPTYIRNPITSFEISVSSPDLGVGMFDQSIPFQNMLLSTL